MVVEAEDMATAAQGGAYNNNTKYFNTHCTQCGKSKDTCKKTMKDGRCGSDQSWRYKKKGNTIKKGVFTLHWCHECGENGSYRMHKPGAGHAKSMEKRQRQAKAKEDKKKKQGPSANLVAEGGQSSDNEGPLHSNFVSRGSGAFF